MPTSGGALITMNATDIGPKDGSGSVTLRYGRGAYAHEVDCTFTSSNVALRCISAAGIGQHLAVSVLLDGDEVRFDDSPLH